MHWKAERWSFLFKSREAKMQQGLFSRLPRPHSHARPQVQAWGTGRPGPRAFPEPSAPGAGGGLAFEAQALWGLGQKQLPRLLTSATANGHFRAGQGRWSDIVSVLTATERSACQGPILCCVSLPLRTTNGHVGQVPG